MEKVQIKIPHLIFEDKRLGKHELTVYSVLAAQNQQGFTSPTYSVISVYSKIKSIPIVEKAIKKLQSTGWITIYKNENGFLQSYKVNYKNSDVKVV